MTVGVVLGEMTAESPNLGSMSIFGPKIRAATIKNELTTTSFGHAGLGG